VRQVAPEPVPALALKLSAPIPRPQANAVRFARLRIDEIKLYNRQSRRGLKQRDLYDRLRDDIDKRAAHYAKRYGNTVAVSGDYFVHRMISWPCPMVSTL